MMDNSTINQYATALSYASFINAAYQVFDAYYTTDRNINPVQEDYPWFPENYTLVYNIHMTDSLLGFKDPVYYGFLAKSNFSPDYPVSYVLALRGTSDYLEWADDLDILPSPTPFGHSSGNVVSGFLDRFNSMTFSIPGAKKPKGLFKDIRYSISIKDLHSDGIQPIVCTGHSLGAALVTLFAAGEAYSLFPCRVYTFASPCVGDDAFVSYYNGLITTSERYYNIPDLVPTILDVFGYNQVNTGIPLNSLSRADISWYPACTHSLNTYMYLLGADASVLNSNCIVAQDAIDVTIKKLSFRKRY